jgi:hypothetical protein
LNAAESSRKEDVRAEISQRREEIANLNTQGLIEEFRTAREEMWRNLKSELEAFTSELARFKGDLDQAETERRQSMRRDLKEKAEDLRAALTGFRSDLSNSVAEMLGELKKNRAEATRMWNELLSAMRSVREEDAATVAAEKPVDETRDVPAAEWKEVEESPPPEEGIAEREAGPDPESPFQPGPEPEVEAEAEPER